MTLILDGMGGMYPTHSSMKDRPHTPRVRLLRTTVAIRVYLPFAVSPSPLLGVLKKPEKHHKTRKASEISREDNRQAMDGQRLQLEAAIRSGTNELAYHMEAQWTLNA